MVKPLFAFHLSENTSDRPKTPDHGGNGDKIILNTALSWVINDIGATGARLGVERFYRCNIAGQGGQCTLQAYTALISAGTPMIPMARLRL